jgi:hypothetical protein
MIGGILFIIFSIILQGVFIAIDESFDNNLSIIIGYSLVMFINLIISFLILSKLGVIR